MLQLAKVSLEVTNLLISLGLSSDQGCYLYDRLVDGFAEDDVVYTETLLKHLKDLAALVAKQGGIR